MSEAVGDMGEATGDVRELIKDIREEAIGDMKEDKEEANELGDRQIDLSFRQESCHINDNGVFLG
jgi:Sec-independent protein translocase protein TatA